MQQVEAVPALAHQAASLRGALGEIMYRRAVGPPQRARAEDQHRVLRRLQHLGEFVPAIGDLRQGLRPGAQMLVLVGQVQLRPDHADLHAALQEALADAGVDDRRLLARIAADDQDGVGLIDPGDARVEQIARALPRIDHRAILAAIDVRRAERAHQFLEREHGLDVSVIAGDGGDAVPGHTLETLGDGAERLVPACRLQLAVAAHIGPVEPLPLQPVTGEARLVGDPLLVHRLVQARQDAHDFVAAGIDADGAADRVHHIDRSRSSSTPRAAP